MMLVSIVGHASFQTADGSGPSTIDRSYRGGADRGPAAVGAGGAVGAADMSRNSRVRSREAQWRPGKLEAEPLRDVANFVEQYRRLWDERLAAFVEPA